MTAKAYFLSLLVGLFGLIGPCHAVLVTVLIDIGRSGNVTATPPPSWNALEDVSLASLVDTDGNSLPLSLTKSGAAAAFDRGSFTGAVTGWPVEEALRDGQFAQGLVTYTISGFDLVMAGTVDLEVQASGDNTNVVGHTSGVTAIDLSGSSATQTIVGATGVQPNIAVFSNLTPDGSGDIAVQMTDIGGNSWTLNAIKLEFVPEPSQAGILTALAALLCAARCTRRRA